MEAYYRVSKLKTLYEPLARVDQKLFPKRWQCQPTSFEEYARALTNLDLIQIHKGALRAQATNAVPGDVGGPAKPK